MATPMQEQYNQIKSEHPEDIVLFRLGDFYEAFHGDAKTLNRVLGITLTGRGKGENRTPMAGIPYHALPNYLPEIIKAGYKVAIVEQLTDPEPGKIVERGVVRVHTPGTILDEASLSKEQSNYLASIAEVKQTYALAVADVSTGKFFGFETSDLTVLKRELGRLQPTEIVVSKESAVRRDLELKNASLVEQGSSNSDYSLLIEQFGTANLKGFGLEGQTVLIAAAAQLLRYVQYTQRSRLEHLKSFSQHIIGEYMLLDEQTIRNLELLWPLQRDGVSLVDVIDNAVTAMGRRKLRDWLVHPLLDKEKIERRHEVVEALLNEPQTLQGLRELLDSVLDCERVVGKLGTGAANARELVGLANSLRQLQAVASELQVSFADAKAVPAKIREMLDFWCNETAIEVVAGLVEENILPDPAISITEGGIIRAEANAEVSQLRQLAGGGKEELAQIQQREAEVTGISSLKVSYNQVFGYYIEITNTHKDKVPDAYVRKQTLTNAERYITQELKELEERILSAQAKLAQLEYDLFVELRERLAQEIPALLKAFNLLAELDVLLGFAATAREYAYVRPEMLAAGKITVSAGRHPVVERLRQQFTPNDLDFSSESDFILLTGPNMSGKSTYLRQTALLVLLAQIGSFVPAKSMSMSPVDRVYSRVGASDNLSRGESTFMVEMTETANILNNATPRSLIILDEVGRGTSTYDGVAIAWAISEHIATTLKSQTIFATHYHELTELDGKLPSVKNYCVQVLEDGKDIIFTHKIVPGAANRSYGVHVAKLAGLPTKVLERASSILEGFEAESNKPESLPVNSGKNKAAQKPTKPRKVHPEQLKLI